MQLILRTFDQNRKNIIALLASHSLEQVNAIPAGFNNNIIWNAGHLLLSQQFLIYHFSGLPMADFVKDFAPGYGSNTKPDGEATQAELDRIIDQLGKTAEQLENDYKSGKFTSYTTYTSEYFGVTMRNIEEALHFNAYHESYHFGFMSAIKVCIK